MLANIPQFGIYFKNAIDPENRSQDSTLWNPVSYHKASFALVKCNSKEFRLKRSEIY